MQAGVAAGDGDVASAGGVATVNQYLADDGRRRPPVVLPKSRTVGIMHP